MEGDDGYEENPAFASNKLAFWEKNLQGMKDKKARSPRTSKTYKTEAGAASDEASDIAKSDMAGSSSTESPSSSKDNEQLEEQSPASQQPGPGAKLQKARKWKDRVSANKAKRKQGGGATSPTPTEDAAFEEQKIAIKGPEFVPYEEAFAKEQLANQKLMAASSAHNVNELSREGAMAVGSESVNEAYDIVNILEEKKGSNEEDSGEAAAEAEDILSSFDGSNKSRSDSSSSSSESRKESSGSDSRSSSSSSGKSSGNRKQGFRQPQQQQEFALGMSDSDSDEVEAVLMHTLSDDDGDISLDKLFETAAALEVTLETENVAHIRQDAYENSTNGDTRDHSLDTVTSNSSISCSTIEEEQTEHIAEEEDDDESSESEEEEPQRQKQETKTPKKTNTTTQKKQQQQQQQHKPLHFYSGGIEAEQPTVYSKSRSLLYDSDDDYDDYEEEGSTGEPMPWFAAVPYSTGKRRITVEGNSIASDDVWNGISGKPIIGRGHHLPYTISNPTYKPAAPKKRPIRKYIYILLAIVALLIFLVVLISLWAAPSEITIPLVYSGNTTNSTAPLPATDASTKPSTKPPTLPPTPVLKTQAPSEPAPTLPPTPVLKTQAPSEPAVVDFKSTEILMGQADGDRFGSVLSMSKDGTFLASMSGSHTEPIQTFSRSETNRNEWISLPSIPGKSDRSSLAFHSSIAASISRTGSRVLALASQTEVEIYHLVDDGTSWVSLGQDLSLGFKKGASYTSVALSSDATTLAVGAVDKAGTSISVTVYRFDSSTNTWTPTTEIDPTAFQDAEQRSINPEEGTILSLSVTLSGDGNVLTIEEWNIGLPQVIVQSFAWTEESANNDSSWSPMGKPMEFPYGPVSIDLSEDGKCFAVVANNPGKGSVYHWDDDGADGEWKTIGGNTEHGFLPGGSDVVLARDCTRILIGDSSQSKASVYDYQDDYEYFHTSEKWSAWMPTVSLWGPDDSSFGASVVMDEAGNYLGIGASSRSFGREKNVGQIAFYA